VKFKIILLSFTILPFLGWTQNDSTSKDEENVFHQVGQEFATFMIGGEEGLLNFVARNVIYPEEALKNKIEGVVWMEFVIDKEGNVSQVFTKGQILGYGLEEESVRVVKLTSGLWKPAKQRGEKVMVKYKMPLRFQLDEKETQNKNKK
jgi:periplasmic protein TonB